MISIARTATLLQALRDARRVSVAAYVLHPGRMLDSLEQAARCGARVTVRLEAHPFPDASGSIAIANATAISRLRAAGADAAFADSAGGGAGLHMKAAVLDGVAYLDDRNFDASGDTIVRDDSPRHVAAVQAAIAGRFWPRGRAFWTTKSDALEGEARLLRGALSARSVVVQTESFGSANGVYAALKGLAERGVACRLIVAPERNAGELRALHILASCGVNVRLANSNEKMAVVDGKSAWIGSSNATSAYYDAAQREWALRTGTLTVTRELERRFQANWKNAVALRDV